MRKLAFSLFLLLFLFLLSCSSLAQVPSTINYQGVLKNNATNELLDGSFDMTFSIYASPEGETPPALWTENHPAVQVANGLYSVQLGDAKPNPNPIGPAIFDGQTKYLEVIVNGQTMSPRVALVSVPYAMQAGGIIGSIEVISQNTAVYGESTSSLGKGVHGVANSTDSVNELRYGVYGESSIGTGVAGISNGETGTGVFAYASGTTGVNSGIQAGTASPTGYSGDFKGGQGIKVEGPITTDVLPYGEDLIINNLEKPSGVFLINCDQKGGDIYITLPPASDLTIGKVFYIYKIDPKAYYVNVKASPTNDLHGKGVVGTELSTKTQWDCIRAICDTKKSWLVSKF